MILLLIHSFLNTTEVHCPSHPHETELNNLHNNIVVYLDLVKSVCTNTEVPFTTRNECKLLWDDLVGDDKDALARFQTEGARMLFYFFFFVFVF